MLYGCAALLVGVMLTFAGITVNSTSLFIIGSTVAGPGFGLSFLGAFRSLSGLAAPSQRAGIIAVIYVIAYLASSVPVVIAGIAVTRFGSHDVALAFTAAIAALAALGAIAGLPSRGRATCSPSQPLHPVTFLPPCPGTVPPYVPRVAPAESNEPT
jgi:hypothetical protein